MQATTAARYTYAAILVIHGALLALPLVAEEDATVPSMDAAIKGEAMAAVTMGLTWLADGRNDKGGWSDEKFPALTALPLWAFARSEHSRRGEVVPKAVEYIVGYQVDSGLHEGAIYHVVAEEKGGGLPNYNTAICIAALAEIDDPKLVPVILAGRKFLSRTQYLGKKDILFHGGMGYDPPTQRPYADLSNSYLAYEAMHRTARFEDMREGETVSLNWAGAIEFIQRCQNDPRFNDRPWASDDESEQGGFAYRPDEFRQNAGSYVKDGVVKFRSMPGMTYAGLLSYIYAGVDRNDPRVKATVAWISRNWQLEKGNRNPEMEGRPEAQEGLYYMYNVMAKGMHAYGRDKLELSGGDVINWRNVLAKKIVALQRGDGSWMNENSRYWEGNPVLVTAYAILALQSTLGL